MAIPDYEPHDVGQHAEAVVQEDELRAMEQGGILETDYLESAPRTHSRVEVVLVLPELHTRLLLL